jgi:hypothetical protein
MGRVWHLSQPPGGGISRQAENMAQPQIKRETMITEVRGKLFGMGNPFCDGMNGVGISFLN